MEKTMHSVVTEVESLVREKLVKNGNVHLADVARWVATAECDEDKSYSVAVAIFCDEAKPLLAILGRDSGFAELECGHFELAGIPDAESAIDLLSLVLDFALANTATQVVDLELSSLRNSGELMPWEVLSFMYFGDPRLDEMTEMSSLGGGDK